MADITMSIDETLELDTIIEKWNDPNNIVNDNNNNFNLSGIQTSTRILDPKVSGKHTITVNGQELTVEVTDLTFVPDSNDLHSNHDIQSISATDGDLINSLSDISGNGYNLSNGNTNPSTYDADLINGNPGLDMPSGSQLYEIESLISQPLTIFFVGSLKNTGASGDQVICGGSNGFAHSTFAEKEGNFRMNANNYPDITPSDTNLHIFSMVFNGSKSIFRIDGNEFTGINSGTESLDKLGINGRVSEDRSPGVQFGQMLVYPIDKSSILSEVESYLADKWNFSI